MTALSLEYSLHFVLVAGVISTLAVMAGLIWALKIEPEDDEQQEPEAELDRRAFRNKMGDW